MSLPPRPHPLARSKRIDRLNDWLEAAWRKGLSPRPSLDPDELWTKAATDFLHDDLPSPRGEEDEADFSLRLERLTHSLARQATLNPLGLTIAHGQLTRVIRQRLQLGNLWRSREDAINCAIAPPIIIVGQMRSGTTRVHRLLATDPAHASTRFCDSWQPVPRSPDTRPAWSAISLGFARILDPWLDTIHPFGVTRPDEELGWLACALDHCAYEAQWRIPSFTQFSEAQDPAPIYREFARILRTDALWRANAGQSRVIKVPQFAEDLPALLAQFPDARVIHTRRCEKEVHASAISLVANQMTIQSDNVELGWIEDECRRKIELRQHRMDGALAGFNGPLATVDFADLDDDWEACVRSIYAQLELPVTPDAIAAMRGEQGRSAKSRHRHHAANYRAFAQA